MLFGACLLLLILLLLLLAATLAFAAASAIAQLPLSCARNWTSWLAEKWICSKNVVQQKCRAYLQWRIDAEVKHVPLVLENDQLRNIVTCNVVFEAKWIKLQVIIILLTTWKKTLPQNLWEELSLCVVSTNRNHYIILLRRPKTKKEIDFYSSSRKKRSWQRRIANNIWSPNWCCG